ncbi:hypothetical protein HKBW3S42_00523 [Candidatus Hakubella thermalkaliphila]|uniref:Uncharacterized protein n=1 Tax=Candidatus Hakubella thermalkaliphila TaxID=2754717 RepID=A0A6V8PIX4_9ACTN|nr:hypothetical protein HKBW3S42_00523 [Candidatus Hakubella thermalkaliphila]
MGDSFKEARRIESIQEVIATGYETKEVDRWKFCISGVVG